MNETGIAWTTRTWNPVSGCEEVSEGCKWCYAKTLAEAKRGTPAFPRGFELTLRPHKLSEPYRLKRGELIFVNSMSDFFWDRISDEYRDRMLDVMIATPQHQYQVLTKRPEKMLEYSKRRELPDNFWAGATVESPRVLHRVDTLREVRASIRFLSAEPLLGPLVPGLKLDGLHWVITGGESGAHLTNARVRARRALVEHHKNAKPSWVPREDRLHWVRDIRDLCMGAGVAFFHKQFGGRFYHSGGRVLDGRTWDEFPRYPSDRKEWAEAPSI
jgi:protein gp37